MSFYGTKLKNGTLCEKKKEEKKKKKRERISDIYVLKQCL